MKFIQTLKDIFSIEELRTRILNTLGFLLLFRLGSYILIPGLNFYAVNANGGSKEGLEGLFNNFLGVAFSGKSIFALGIMPYISASIVVQLMGVAVPYFQKLQKDGESGRNKMNQITRFLTIAICLVQAIGYNQATLSNEIPMLLPNITPFYFQLYATIILVSGTMFCVWLGEKITEKGIGNGVSLLIMVGIVSRFIPAIYNEITVQFKETNLVFLLLEFIVWMGIIMAIIMLVQAVRQVPLSYAKQMISNKAHEGQRSYLPLKVNAAGVMPIIFAQALMFLPSFVFTKIDSSNKALTFLRSEYSDSTSWTYTLSIAFLILVFTYFYTAITIHPTQISEDLRRNGGFIPGIKPGQATADYIDDILSKITLPGALAIASVAILPSLARMANVKSDFADFFGGTSLLILVGVVLDTIQQVDSYLILKKYDGLMKSGRVRGRAQNMELA
jgi:preprotein translocase subunit SecY